MSVRAVVALVMLWASARADFDSCNVIEPSMLFDFVNSSAHSRQSAICDDISTVYGPRLGVGIVTPMRSAKTNHSTYALAVNEYYARRHGYAFRIENLESDEGDIEHFRMSWDAVKYLREALKGWAKDLDYVAYLGPDAVFIDLDVRIEQLLVKKKKSNAIFVAGGALTGTMISTDIIIVRNNLWTTDTLDDWWHFSDRKTKSDTDTFDDFFKAYEEDIKDYITILPANSLKNDYPAMAKMRPQNQILHLPLEVTQFKRMVFEEAFDVVCQHASNNPANEYYPVQLGFSREKLMAYSLQIYRDLWDEKYESYSAKAPNGDNTYEETERFSTVALHLCSTLDSISLKSDADNSELTSSADSLRIRSKTFKNMFLNLKRYRSRISDGSALSAKELANRDKSFAPMLKVVLRSGQDYMGKVKDQKDRKVAVKVVREILEDLLEIKENDAETQEALVNMNVDLGMINMNERKYNAALSDFLAGLRVARRVGAVIGDQVVLAPASQAADAMVMLNRFEEAVVLYDTVVGLAKKHHGEDDITTGLIMTQAAMANHYYNKHKKAHKLIDSALQIFNSFGQDKVDSSIYQHALDLYKKTENRKDEEYIENEL